jgi:phospholipid/cholesterol/gamma-HCH transport system substrate-binding protein
MKISNELRVGLLTLGAAGIFVWGFYFLKGRNLFSSSTSLYAEYANLEGLAPSALVVINGLRVGTVADIHLKEDGSGRIVVRMELGKGVQVPKCAIARIKAPDLMGAKQISLEFHPDDKKNPCGVKDGLAEDGATLQSASSNLVESFLGTDINPIVEKTEIALDTLNRWLRGAGTSKQTKDAKVMVAEVQQTIHNLKTATDNVNQLVAASNANISAITKNLASVTGNFAQSNNDIQATLRNANTFSSKLNTLKLDATVENANNTIAGLQETIKKLNGTIANLSTTLDKANNGNGTLGALLNDRTLYDDLRTTALQFQLLSQDIRLHPERYRTILSGKDKPYKAPTDEETANDLKQTLAPGQSVKLRNGKTIELK